MSLNLIAVCCPPKRDSPRVAVSWCALFISLKIEVYHMSVLVECLGGLCRLGISFLPACAPAYYSMYERSLMFVIVR